MKTRKAWAALALLMAAAVAGRSTAGVNDVRKTVEASMLVSGIIEVDPEGRVTDFEIYRLDKVPATVRELIDEAVPAWRFEPTLAEGKPAWVRTQMDLRVVATRTSDAEDAVVLRIESATFGAWSEFSDPKSPRAPHNDPPSYPRKALELGVSGSVYLVLRIDREGRVEEALAERVNLHYLATEREMDRLRKMFAKAAERAALDWTFRPPNGPDADAPTWSARVPITFAIEGEPEPDHGGWTLYVPGPRQQAPWLAPEDSDGGDAYAAGGVYPVGAGPKLLTAL